MREMRQAACRAARRKSEKEPRMGGGARTSFDILHNSSRDPMWSFLRLHTRGYRAPSVALRYVTLRRRRRRRDGRYRAGNRNAYVHAYARMHARTSGQLFSSRFSLSRAKSRPTTRETRPRDRARAVTSARGKKQEACENLTCHVMSRRVIERSSLPRVNLYIKYVIIRFSRGLEVAQISRLSRLVLFFSLFFLPSSRARYTSLIVRVCPLVDPRRSEIYLWREKRLVLGFT